MGMAKDYKLELKIKNGYLSLMMSRAGIKNAAELSRLSGVNQSAIGKMLSLAYTPIAKNGDMNPSAERLCEYFECPIESLFPMEHMHCPLEQNTFEGYVDRDEMERISGCPSELIALSDRARAVSNAMSAITDRERAVLEMRFGINQERCHTLEEVGKQLGVTSERIRNIEGKAIRKLRQTKSINDLRQVAL